MPPKKVTGKYGFCINAPYYQMLVQLFIKKKTELDNIKNCDNFSQDKTFLKHPSATQICKEFTFLHDSLSNYRGGENRKNETFTEEDCNFLNYWLNDKLRNNNKDISICVKEIYDEIKGKNEAIFSKHRELDEHMVNIETEILENMKYLYELYYNAVKIINMMRGQDYSDEEQENEEHEKQNKKEQGREEREVQTQGKEEHEVQPQEKEEHEAEERNDKKNKSCSDYIMECDKNYKEGMDRCLDINDDFYNALKIFKDSYGFLTEPSSDILSTCDSSKFLFFPEYDSVLDNQRRIMAGKILSAPLILSFAIPLLYKYTPFGPFLRTKINMVRGRWMNQDKNENELLSSLTDIEDNISDQGEYKIGYYSGTD
ncbi:PIR protein [Plasmodium ovale]|uniref:PIR Superfamily Protein n=2 Tax=Plasmodium ovale TaxID=36330 RepID=A0A1A8WRU0_PLAOA|nr:PIR Superfamily Protein [Plasmodium ovale curtisi]SBT84789.1 PIR protein [Plasmodium ovale]